MIPWLLSHALANGVLSDGSGYVPLTALELELVVEGRIATGTHRYAFDPAPPGTTLSVALPEGSALTGLRVRLDGTWIEAGATADPPAPGGPEGALPGEVVAVDLPGGSASPIEVEVDWQALLIATEGRLALTIPMSDGGLNPSDPVVRWTGTVIGEAPLDSFLASPGTAWLEAGVGHSSGSAPLSALDPWRLEWTEPPPLFGLALWTYRPALDPYTGEGEPAGYALLALRPGPADPAARVDALYTFVLDSSASMQGAPMRTAVRAAADWLETLAPEDRFNLVPYTSVAIPFRGRAPRARPEAVDRAVRFLERQQPAGLSDPAEGLVTALVLAEDTLNQRSFFSCAGTRRRGAGPPLAEAPIRPARGAPIRAAPYLVWITDGGASAGTTDPGALAEEIAGANAVGASIFAVGVGDQVDRELLERVVGEHRGEVRYAATVDEVPAVVEGLRDRIAHPVLVQPRLELPDAFDQAPEALPDVALGTEVLAAFRYEGAGPVEITLRGLRGAARTTERYEAVLPSLDEARPVVARAWAQLRVADLDRRYLAGETALYEPILALVQDYGVASRVVGLGFATGSEGAEAAADAALSAEGPGPAGCACATPRGLAGGLPLGLVTLLALRARRTGSGPGPSPP